MHRRPNAAGVSPRAASVDGLCRSRLSLTYYEVSEEPGEVEQATPTRALRLRGDIAAHAIDDLEEARFDSPQDRIPPP
jgi:hypothetical protein